MPSSLAIALAAHRRTQAAEIGVLHDGRRKQAILTRVTFHQGVPSLQAPEILDLDRLAMADAGVLTTTQAELIPQLPAEITDRVVLLSGIPAEELLLAPGAFPMTQAAQEASCEPIYVRPPVFVEPVKASGQ